MSRETEHSGPRRRPRSASRGENRAADSRGTSAGHTAGGGHHGGHRRRWRGFSGWWRYNWRHNRGGMTFLTLLCLLTVTAAGVTWWWTHWAVEPDLPDFNMGDNDNPGSTPGGTGDGGG